jgi:Apea-like HEPN
VTNTSERTDLVVRIAALAGRAVDPEYLSRFNPESSQYQHARLTQVGGIPKEELDALGRDLARYFGLDPNGHIYVRSSPAGAGSWQARMISSRLVARARFANADAVLAEFERAFATNAADVHEVIAIWGLHPSKAIEVRAGIHLIPLSELPPSPARDVLLGIPTHANFTEEVGGFHVRARPKAALVRSFRLSPVVSAAPGPPFTKRHVTFERREEMLDVVRCLTLLVPRPVEQIGSWFQTDHPLLGAVDGWGGQSIRWGHQFEVAKEDINPPQVRTFIDRYFALSQGTRQRLHIVLDRLNAAKRPQTFEDRAVDLGVSLEALLFNPKDVPAEISLKFKLRGSVLATEDPEERKAVFKLLDRLYTYRSTAAHGGAIDPVGSSVETDLTEGISLASRLIQRVLALRRIPENWNGLILGWDKLK